MLIILNYITYKSILLAHRNALFYDGKTDIKQFIKCHNVTIKKIHDSSLLFIIYLFIYLNKYFICQHCIAK